MVDDMNAIILRQHTCSNSPCVSFAVPSLASQQVPHTSHKMCTQGYEYDVLEYLYEHGPIEGSLSSAHSTLLCVCVASTHF